MTSLIELLTENEKKIREIVLTEEEREAAILEGKRKKYFHERNKLYWERAEGNTGKHSDFNNQVENRGPELLD